MVQTPIKLEHQYPDSDGKPMADNTEQFDWITLIVGNLKHLLKNQEAFVAGDLLWYPMQVGEDEKAPSQAPDAMVVFGRPKGRRGSYRQWEEKDTAPQVVFEILSPSNTRREMSEKQRFYENHGVLEMYYYDPQRKDFWGFVRDTPDEFCTLITALYLPWVSPLLNIRFELPNELEIFHPNGEMFAELEEVAEERDRLKSKLTQTEAKLTQTTTERDRAFAKLRELGIDPSEIL
ncbi:MAG: Uma2 family endonuclease [Spirulina sp. SIO3F2]|nr:Uma2 family endonuclease [Spirulina sp. SIO3F2]